MAELSHNATLILIDLQKAIDHPSWGQRNNPGAEANVARLLAAWRRTSRPVVHIRYVSREQGSTFRGTGVEFKEVARPAPGELVITKPGASAFIGTSLEEWLRRRGIEELVVTGVITNNSVEATARVAGDLGFRTTVVSDATFTFGRQDYDGRHRTAEEVHAMSLANLDGQYALIRTTEEVINSAGA